MKQTAIPSYRIQEELQKPALNYTDAKEHAKNLDALLGYDCSQIETEIFKDNKTVSVISPRQFWVGLDIQSLQTPYSEMVEMLKVLDPKPGELWLDLGAAYGRMGIVLGFLRPLVHFVGYEFLQSRVDEGNRILKKWKLTQARLLREDLAAEKFELKEADLYFIYDFGSKEDIYSLLAKLKVIAARRPVRVIARGRGVRNWIAMDFPWLSGIHPARHFENWSLFQS